MFVSKFLTILLISYAPFLHSEILNYADFDWLNETQLLMYNNGTNTTSANNRTDISDNFQGSKNSSSSTISLGAEQVQQEQLMKIAIFALLLHALVVGTGIVIYSCVYCQRRDRKTRRQANAQQRFQLSHMQHQHVPNSPNCPCEGCRLARQMLHGLIMQKIQEVVEC